VTINDVLPLKATRCNAIANLKCFRGPRDTIDLISMVSFTVTTRRHLIRLASAPLTSSRLAKYWVPFAVCNAWQRSRTQNLRRMGKNSGLILSRLWTKVHEIFRRCRRPFVLFKALIGCLYHISFRRYSPKSCRKWGNCKSFWSQFLGGTTPTFLRRIVTVWQKLGWVPFAEKRGNKFECRIYVGRVKWRSKFKPFARGPQLVSF